MKSLQEFLNSTEVQKPVASKEQMEIRYPLLYIEKITSVELTHLVETGVLKNYKNSEDDVQLFLKAGGYRFLGWVPLTLKTVFGINAFRENPVHIKLEREKERLLDSSVVNMMLLKE